MLTLTVPLWEVVVGVVVVAAVLVVVGNGEVISPQTACWHDSSQ